MFARKVAHAMIKNPAKALRRLGLAAAIAMLVIAPAAADQTTLVTPGSPLTMPGLASFLDNATKTLGSNFSGNTPPATYSGTAKTYQFWLDSSSGPTGNVLRINDGAQWVTLGTLDATNHIFSAGGPAGAITLVSGLNSNIANPGVRYARIAGPTGAFSLGGFAAPAGMQELTVYNSASQTMTIVNEDASSTAANRIKTLTGGNVVLRSAAPSAATFIYDPTDLRWVLTSSN